MSEKKDEANVSRRSYIKYGAAAVVVVAAGAGGAYYYSTMPPPTPAPTATQTVTATATGTTTVTLPAVTSSASERDYYYDPSLSGQSINVVMIPLAPLPGPADYVPLFEKETGIKVNVVQLSNNLVVERLTDMFVAKSDEFDAVQNVSDGISVAFFAGNGWLDDLMPYVQKTPASWNLDDFAQSCKTWMTLNSNKLYVVSPMVASNVLAYRTDLIGEGLYPLPTNTDELLAAIKNFNKPPNMYGFNIEGFKGENLYLSWWSFFKAYGGHFWDAGWNPTINTINDEGYNAGEESISYYIELIKNCPPGALSIDWGDVPKNFAAGLAAMAYVGNILYPLLVDPTFTSKDVLGNVGLAKSPPGPKGHDTSNSVGVGLGINTFSTKKDATWSFISFAYSPRIMKDMAGRPWGYTTRESVIADPILETRAPWVGETVEWSNKADPNLLIPEGAKLEALFLERLSAAIGGSVTAKEAADGMQADLQGVLSSGGYLSGKAPVPWVSS